MGEDLMETFCNVRDFQRAKAVIEEVLSKTEFSDYQKIYQEVVDCE